MTKQEMTDTLSNLVDSLLESDTDFREDAIIKIDEIFEDYASDDFFGTERQNDPRGDGRDLEERWFEQFDEDEDGNYIDEDGEIIDEFDGDYAHITTMQDLEDAFEVMSENIDSLDIDEDELKTYAEFITEIESVVVGE